MQASYVWSEAKGDAEAFQQALGNDPGTTEDEFGFLCGGPAIFVLRPPS
jgi:hypothetical protein